MLIDIRQLADGARIESDICIVGAGAAGITLARDLARRGRKVCLLESGGLEYDEDTQDLYNGEDVGIPYDVNSSRLRYFGGATNHWVGRCRPVDPGIFEVRPWVPHSGWPIAYEDLAPYYLRAQEVCELGPARYDARYWEGVTGYKGLPLDESRVTTTIWQYSPPTRFGEVYRDEIEKSENIAAYLNANVVDFSTDENARHVTGLKVASLNGKSFEVTGREFVLAAGALENPRLMLSANRVQKEGIRNSHDLVGRYFMEHPHLVASVLMLTKADTDLDLYLGTRPRGFRAGLSLTEEVQRMERLLSFNTTLESARGGEESEGYTSLREIGGGWRKERIPDNLWEHLGNVATDFDDVASALYGRFFGVVKAQQFLMHANSEQAPNPDSRVRLADEIDALGMRRIALDWRLSEQDRLSLIRSIRLLAEEVGRAGLGRIKILLSESDDDWPLFLYGGNHHMGTTRMAEDRRKGVVNGDCRVHDVENLYIAGSSVFPVSGVSNPTLTIVALALRLADHLVKSPYKSPHQSLEFRADNR